MSRRRRPSTPYSFVLDITNDDVVHVAAKAVEASRSPFASECEVLLQKFILQHCYSDVYDWVMKHPRDCRITFKNQQFRLMIRNDKLETLFRLTFPDVPVRKDDL